MGIATVLAVSVDENGKLYHRDEQLDAFVEVATCVIKLARGNHTNKDMTASAQDGEVIWALTFVPKQVYELLGGSLHIGRLRLLELLPSSEDDPVICRLINVAVGDVPAFEALSYVWDTPDAHELVGIDINGE